MKRLLAVVLFALFATLPMPAVSAQSTSGDAICAAAIAGEGQFANYDQVSPSGGAGSQVVVGTEGDDVLSGGSGNDVLCGLGGTDVLSGGSGSDILVGGSGVDQLFGNSGGDTIYGEIADAVLSGGSGSNEIIGDESPLPPPAPVLAVTVNAPDETNTCNVSFTLSNGPANTTILVDVQRQDGTGRGVTVPSDDLGFAEGVVSGITIGTTIVSAEARDDTLSVIITEIQVGQTCGE